MCWWSRATISAGSDAPPQTGSRSVSIVANVARIVRLLASEIVAVIAMEGARGGVRRQAATTRPSPLATAKVARVLSVPPFSDTLSSTLNSVCQRSGVTSQTA